MLISDFFSNNCLRKIKFVLNLHSHYAKLAYGVMVTLRFLVPSF